MTGRIGSLSGGGRFQITCLELYERRSGSSSYYYLPIASGYTSLDYFVGPYTMVQTVDADGNVLSTDEAVTTNTVAMSGSAAKVTGSECVAAWE